MSRSNLKVLEALPFFNREIELWSDDSAKDSHSFHHTIPYPESTRPELANYFVKKYSSAGGVVLDPFCGGGTIPLEAVLLGRSVLASDSNPLAVRISRAKLLPCDLTEVTLALQKINLRRPINVAQYRSVFSPFYDIETFCELCGLKAYVAENHNRVSAFIELMALSLLHGHTAGFFSAYSFPQIALLPEEQEKINVKRRQIPDYRAIVPRILRKTASVLRDGITSGFSQVAAKSQVLECDARALSHARTASVDLVLTAPPLPLRQDFPSENWLRLWFAGVSAEGVNAATFPFAASPFSAARQENSSDVMTDWSEFMNGVLLECARVVKPGGRAVLDLREVQINDTAIYLDDEVLRIAQDELSRYWEAEGVLVHRPQAARIKDSLRSRDHDKLSRSNRMLILRRR